MIYALLIALVVGVTLGLLGSGGAILTTPALHYLLGHPEKQAIAESLAIVGAIALVGGVRGLIDGSVDRRSVVFFGVPGMAGALAGAFATRYVPGAVQLALLGVVMLGAAVIMLRKKDRAEGAEGAPAVRPPVARLAAQGFGVGAVTGLVGVGGGFLIVPALTGLAGLPMRRAIPTSLAIIALNSAVGFLKQQPALAKHGLEVDWRIIGVFAAIGIVGSVAGAALSERLAQRTLRRLFAALLVVLGVFIVARQGHRLATAPSANGAPAVQP